MLGSGRARASPSYDNATYMLPAAATWLPVTILKFLSAFTLLLLMGVVALSTTGDWAAEDAVRVPITGCASGPDAFGAGCSGVDFARGVAASYEFRGMAPSMRWLRLNLELYVAPGQPLRGNETVGLLVGIAARDADGEAWSPVFSGETERPLDCPIASLRAVEPCALFNAAFLYGLSRRQYRLTLALLRPEAGVQLRGASLRALHGQATLGQLDLGLRLACLACSLCALGSFGRAMWAFSLRHWLPQQQAVLGFLLALILYNDPGRALATLRGAPDYFAPALFRSAFVASGAVLSLALIDLRRLARADAGGDGARGQPPRLADDGSGADADGVSGSSSGSESGDDDDDEVAAVDAAADLAAGYEHAAPAELVAPRPYSFSAACLGATYPEVSPRAFWLPKVALGAALFGAAASLDGQLHAAAQLDTGATYTSVPGWPAWYWLEGLLAATWLLYALRLELGGAELAAAEARALRREAEAGVLPLDGAISHLSSGYLAMASSFVLCVCAIHLREVARTRAADHPWYSDSAFETQLSNLLIANALGVGLALAFRPSAHSDGVHRAGGLRKALEQGQAGFGALRGALGSFSKELRARAKQRARAIAAGASAARSRIRIKPPAVFARAKGLPRAGTDGVTLAVAPRSPARARASKTRYFISAPAPAQGSSVDMLAAGGAGGASGGADGGHALLSRFLRRYVRRLRRAYASPEPLSDASLVQLRELQGLLESVPQTARHAYHLKWRYPLLFTSRQTHLWAVLVKDVDSEAGRAYWTDKHAGLADALGGAKGGSGGDGEAPSVAALVAHLRAKGLALEARSVQALVGGPHVLLLLRSSEAVRAQHLRAHARRCAIEHELSVRSPARICAADTLRAIGALLTDGPMAGQSHAGFEPGRLSLKAAGLELVSASYPLHDRELNGALHAELRAVYVLSDEQLGVLRAHYGEEVAFYYALLNFVCAWLSPIAGLGLLFLLLRYSDAQQIYDALYIPFASLCVVWAALLFVFWRRKAAALAVRWDVSSLHAAQEPNPAYTGGLVPDEVHGARPAPPRPWSRLPAFGLTACQMVLQGGLLVVLEFAVYAHWVWLNEKYDRPGQPALLFYLHSYVLNALLYIVLIMYGQYLLWAFVAKKCTANENWDNRRSYERNYVSYVFLFIWLDGYMWSLIIGLVHIPMVETYEGDLTQVRFPLFGQLFQSNDRDADYWMEKHDATIIAMISVNQIAGLFAENIAPLLFAWAFHKGLHRRMEGRTARAAGAGAAGGAVASAGAPADKGEQGGGEAAAREAELALAEQRALEEWWLAPYSTQDDYYDVVLFIGYIATYSVIWPLTPLMCWVNNHIELRTDLVKINKAWQRNVPRRTAGIGAWEPALGVSICAAVLMVTSLACIGTRRAEIFFVPAQNPAHPLHDVFWNAESGHVWFSWRFVVLFAWEHALGLLIFGILFLLPRHTPALLDLRRLKAKRHIDELLARCGESAAAPELLAPAPATASVRGS